MNNIDLITTDKKAVVFFSKRKKEKYVPLFIPALLNFLWNINVPKKDVIFQEMGAC